MTAKNKCFMYMVGYFLCNLCESISQSHAEWNRNEYGIYYHDLVKRTLHHSILHTISHKYLEILSTYRDT